MPKRSQTPPKYPNSLRELIQHNGLTLTEVAQETDIPLRTLSDYCAGRLRIPHQRLEEFARIIGCTVEDIVPKYEPRETSSEQNTFFWNIPYPRNPFFTGREELLQNLYDAFHGYCMDAAYVQALSGLGGVGKTHLALEYAYRYHHIYEAIFWIKADTRENLCADFLVIAQLLHLPEQHAEQQMITVASVLHWLEIHPKWLLIYDNADDLSVLPPFMSPAFTGHILLTTRAQAVNRLARKVTVECMTTDTGTLLLLRRASLLPSQAVLEQASENHLRTASQVVEELGGLPLAIDQVGAYIEETAYHLDGYLTLYHKQRANLLQRRGGMIADHAAPVATTWKLSFERIEQTDPLAISMLHLCAFLDPDAIPEEILLQGLQMCTPVNDIPIDELRLNDAIEVLLRFSLIQRTIETRMLSIHRLVQIIIQDSMDRETQQLWAKRAISAVSKVLPLSSTVYSASGYPHYAVQLLKTSIYIQKEKGDTYQLATTLWNIAVQQQVLGRLSTSERYLKDCIELCNQTNDWFNLAKAYQYLALLRAYQGIFDDSLKHLNTAMSLFEQGNSTDSQGAVWAYRALCMLLADDVLSALTAARQAHQLAELRQNNRDIIRSKWLLGWGLVHLTNQKRELMSELCQEATSHLEMAFERCHHTNTVDYTADLLLALGRLYLAQKDNNRAEQCAKEALDITNRSSFRLLRADIQNLLAKIEIEKQDWKKAEKYVAAALADAHGDGVPYCYVPAITYARSLLTQISGSSFTKE